MIDVIAICQAEVDTSGHRNACMMSKAQWWSKAITRGQENLHLWIHTDLSCSKSSPCSLALTSPTSCHSNRPQCSVHDQAVPLLQPLRPPFHPALPIKRRKGTLHDASSPLPHLIPGLLILQNFAALSACVTLELVGHLVTKKMHAVHKVTDLILFAVGAYYLFGLGLFNKLLTATPADPLLLYSAVANGALWPLKIYELYLAYFGAKKTATA